ncbi:MAG: hypothetical protein ABEJ65_07870 [bacterium]
MNLFQDFIEKRLDNMFEIVEQMEEIHDVLEDNGIKRVEGDYTR